MRKARVYATKIQLKTHSTFMKSINDMTGFGSNSRGFTMIEIIAVLLVLGIISAFAVSRIVSTQSYKDLADIDVLKMHIRYAQLKAMSYDSETSNCNASFGIVISGPTYYLFHDCDTNKKITMPNASSDTISLSSSITSSCNTFCFDAWGAPYCSSGCSAPGVLGTSSPITITLGGTGFIIKEYTGFIP